ncbi:four helix bundle protein [Povalibacter sp.]|uniref:four helix bundle protein n=1 Tax=Povalibacter sp. TaxID=1962978 RepID=UPI002F42D028
MAHTSFESLRVWHDARHLSARIYQTSNSAAFERDRGLRDQIRRAAISVMSNIAEGCERGSRKEFAYFLSIAKGSVGELRSQLYAIEDIGYLEGSVAADLRHDAKIIARRISALITVVRKNIPANKASP